MSTYIPLITALKSGIIKPEDFVAYTPDKKRSMFTEAVLFGTEIKETEFDLGYHAVVYKDFGVLLVADKATKETITTSNDFGIGAKTLEEYSDLYKNEALQSTGVAPTAEILHEIPENLRLDNVWYVATSTFRRRSYHRNYNPAYPHDHRRYSGPTYDIKPMQPMLFIPPDTIVEIEEDSKVGKPQKNGFKLHPRKSLTISKLPAECLEFASTPIWVPLTEAVRTKAILSTDFVEYVPDKASVSFSPEETNTESIQTAETEYDMGGYHPIILKKGKAYRPYLVATHCSKFKLEIWPETKEIRRWPLDRIIGKNQFDIGTELLNRYAQIYSCTNLNVQAIPFTEELFDALDCNLILEHDTYFLANTFAYNFQFITETHERRMGLMWIAHSIRGYYKHATEVMSKLSIRIAIPLPENIMVQINHPQYDGSTEERALKIKLADKENNNN